MENKKEKEPQIRLGHGNDEHYHETENSNGIKLGWGELAKSRRRRKQEFGAGILLLAMGQIFAPIWFIYLILYLPILGQFDTFHALLTMLAFITFITSFMFY